MAMAERPQGIEVWRTPGFDGMLFYRGANVTHPYPRHWHEEIHFCAYTSGSGNLAIRGRSQQVGNGDFTITPAGEVHENWVNDELGCSFRSLYLDMDLLSRLVHQVFGRKLPMLDFKDLSPTDGRLQPCFLRLHHVMSSAASQLERETALLEFVRALVSCSCTPCPAETRAGHEGSAVHRIRGFIEEYFADAISLEDLARIANLSPFHLHRVFTQAMGMPPHAYQTQLRINRAKQLMRQKVPLCHVAMAAGFADQSHLTRHFRRLVGVTPGQFAS